MKKKKGFYNTRVNRGKVHLNEKMKMDNYLNTTFQAKDYMKTLMMDKTSFESRNNSDAHNLDSKNQSHRTDTLTV